MRLSEALAALHGDGLGLGATVLDRMVRDRAGGNARADFHRPGWTLLPGALVCYREWYGESAEQPSAEHRPETAG
jgi:hypothetical protein